MKALKLALDAQGCVMNDMNNRSGKRRVNFIWKNSNWCGARKKKQDNSYYGKDTTTTKIIRKGQKMKMEIRKQLFHSVTPESMQHVKMELAKRFLEKSKRTNS